MPDSRESPDQKKMALDITTFRIESDKIGVRDRLLSTRNHSKNHFSSDALVVNEVVLERLSEKGLQSHLTAAFIVAAPEHGSRSCDEEPPHVFNAHGRQCSTQRLDEGLLGAG
jgi:hypothetical protein